MARSCSKQRRELVLSGFILQYLTLNQWPLDNDVNLPGEPHDILHHRFLPLQMSHIHDGKPVLKIKPPNLSFPSTSPPVWQLFLSIKFKISYEYHSFRTRGSSTFSHDDSGIDCNCFQRFLSLPKPLHWNLKLEARTALNQYLQHVLTYSTEQRALKQLLGHESTQTQQTIGTEIDNSWVSEPAPQRNSAASAITSSMSADALHRGLSHRKEYPALRKRWELYSTFHTSLSPQTVGCSFAAGHGFSLRNFSFMQETGKEMQGMSLSPPVFWQEYPSLKHALKILLYKTCSKFL